MSTKVPFEPVLALSFSYRQQEDTKASNFCNLVPDRKHKEVEFSKRGLRRGIRQPGFPKHPHHALCSIFLLYTVFFSAAEILQ